MNTITAASHKALDPSRIRARWFYINAVAGPALLISMFLPWYTTSGTGLINGHPGSMSAWQTFGALNVYLVWCGLGCITVAPWIAARGDRLSWTPGELSIFFAVVGLALILFNGFIARPGSPSEDIHLGIGYPIALAAMAAIMYSSLLRAGVHRPARRPPGTLG
jgi:hypothetical protein